MRRIVFVFLIVAVVAVVGFFAFLEFRTNEIFFESDAVDNWDYGTRVRRAYRSGVDVDAFFAQAEGSLVTAEFTEEELLAAAYASGVPEFAPSFYFNIYNPDSLLDVFNLVAMVKAEMLPDQTNFNFMIANLNLEIMTDGSLISNLEFNPGDDHEHTGAPGTPIISADGRSLAVNLGSVTEYTLTLTGTGRVSFQYVYSVVTNSIFPRPALEEQLLIVHANISRGEGGELVVQYIKEPYSMVEELLGW
jgi:hypothetical protein